MSSFDVLRAAARRKLDADDLATLRHHAAALRDPAALPEAADWHRLTAVLASHSQPLRDLIPADVLNELNDRARTAAMMSLSFTRLLVQVADAFTRARVPYVAFKGPALAQLAWADVTLRPYADLDLLVTPADRHRAFDVLAQLGFTRRHVLNPQQDRIFAAMDGDYPLASAATGQLIELHCQVTPRRFALSLPVAELLDRSVEISVGGSMVRTLDRVDTILTACVHGSKHRWSALGWLADVAELLRTLAPGEWDLLLVRAEQAHARRIVAHTLILARDLLDVPLPARVEATVDSDLSNAALAAAAAAVLQSHSPGGPAEMARFNYDALDSRSARGVFAIRWLFPPTAEDFEALTLPAFLTPAYYVIRPLRLAWRYALRRS